MLILYRGDNQEMDLDEFRVQRDAIYEKKMQPSLKRMPPWAIRAIKEMRDAFMHPDLQDEFTRLLFCERQSIAQNYGVLVAVFAQTYGLSVEYAERLVTFAITKNKMALEPRVPMAGIHFFSNEKKTAGVTSNPDNLYRHLQSEYGKERPSTVYLRIGPSSTKNDVIAYVNKYWGKYVQPLRDAEIHKGQQVKDKRKSRRDAMIYALWKAGKSYPEIRDYIEKHYEYVGDGDLRKIVERMKPKSSFLAEFRRQFDELYPKARQANKKLALKKADTTNGQEPLLQLEIV